MGLFDDSISMIKLVARAEEGDQQAMQEIVMMAAASLTDDAEGEVVRLYLKYLEELTKNECGPACIVMGDEFIKGRFMRRDHLKAIQMYNRAIRVGETFGYECKGQLYFDGDAVAQDYQQALMFFEQAITAHYLNATEAMAKGILFSEFPEIKMKQIGDTLYEHIYGMALSKLSFSTLFALGEIYRQGLCGEKDVEKAVVFYERIVYSDLEVKELDDYYRCACCRLALMLFKGEGTRFDLYEAMRLFRIAKEITPDDDCLTPKAERILTDAIYEMEEALGAREKNTPEVVDIELQFPEVKMPPEKKIISQGHAESFLVCDKSFKSLDAPFFAWLKNEGFEYAWHKGHYGCDWVFVNITRKQFAYGMPGIEVTKAIGNHAITKEEFMVIYTIYKKYEGDDLFACRSTDG